MRKIIKESLPKNYIGSHIEAICSPVSVLYPKNTGLTEIEVEEWCIVSVDIKDLNKGYIPKEFDQAWGGPDHFYNIVIKGEMSPLYQNKLYYIDCEVVWDDKYGLGYNVCQINEKINLEDPKQKELFLRTILTDSKADLLYEAFDDPFTLLQNKNIETLCRARGIGRTTAEELITKFQNGIRSTKKYLILCEKYGLTHTMIKKLEEVYKSIDIIVAKIEENPYVLMEVDGFGWKKTDAVALRGGYDPLGEFRLKAYTEYLLDQEAKEKGNTWITLDYLVEEIKKNIEGSTNEIILPLLKKWTGRDNSCYLPFLYYEQPTRRISLLRELNMEKNICEEINRIKNATVKKYNNSAFEQILKDCEQENGWQYTEEQRDAIKGCLDNNIVIITGFAGVGKSSIMKPLTRFLRATGQTFAQCSLAGKAASNLSEVTNEEGSTIHRLLGYNSEDGGFEHNKENPLDVDLVIVDEMSMNDNAIFYSLIQAIPYGGKIIMLGDTNQLEPIGTGNLLKDMTESNKIAYYKLTKIMRQAARSGIITESLKVANKEQIIGGSPTTDIRGELRDLKIVTYTDSNYAADVFISEYKKLLSQNISFKDIMGVVPMKSRGKICCLQLNNLIQSLVNGDENQPCIKVGEYTLRLGDKVVNRKNHYDTLRWVKEPQLFSEDELRECIFNGNTGYIVDIDTINRSIVVDFTQQGKIIIPSEYLIDIELGYVCTAHVAQGSQSPYVIVGLDMSAYVLLTKEWLYTAMTRARKYCILTGEVNAIRTATRTSKVAKKQTWLEELLKKETKI